MRSLSKHIDALQCFQARVLITFSLFYVTTNSKSHPHWKTARITRRKKEIVSRFETTPLMLIHRLLLSYFFLYNSV